MLDPRDESTEEEKQALERGRALFNAGNFFEAHEAWEDAWNLAPLPADGVYSRKRFYQGLIQCAVALEHMRRGNPRGAVRVFASAQAKFTGCPQGFLGLDHGSMRAELAQMVETLRAMPPEMFEPRQGRGLALPVDWRQAPKLARRV